jgi:hypothetical protein
MRRKYLFSAIVFCIVTSFGTVQANQQQSTFGHIIWFETGWSQDTMAVILDVPMVNPSGCHVITVGYALDPTDPGVRVHEAALMGAYFANKRVAIRADGCVFDKPRIIGVAVQN